MGLKNTFSYWAETFNFWYVLKPNIGGLIIKFWSLNTKTLYSYNWSKDKFTCVK